MLILLRGGNMLDKVVGPRLGADINPYLIAMWQAVSRGWLPPEHFTEEAYNIVRQNKDAYIPELVGYVGFALSYGGKWFGGWSRDSAGKRDYVTEAYKNAIQQFPLFRGVAFFCSDYLTLEFPEGSIVYCDPPYKGTTKYKNEFDSEQFWFWVRGKSRGNQVFVSEYEAPGDFDVLWEGKITSSLTKNTGSKFGVERLFRMHQ